MIPPSLPSISAHHLPLQMYVRSLSSTLFGLSAPSPTFRTKINLAAKYRYVSAHHCGILTSVLRLFSFHGFLHLGNPRKPAKTRKLGNSETYVLFPGNISK